MIVPNNSAQLKHSTNLSHERRASTTTTTSPPSYEATLAADHAPAVIPDEKTYDDELLHKSHCNDSSLIQPSSDGKEVYSETPSAFSRIPRVGPQSFEAFSPMEVQIFGSAKSLDKGLPSGIPQASAVPHPFGQRDINEADWNRFIQDLRDGTTLPKSLGKAILIPATIGFGIGAYFLNKAIKAKIRAKKLKYAINVINTWNQSFFVPRRVEVILVRGETKLTSTEPVAASQKLMNRKDQSSDSVARQNDSTSKGYGCCGQPQEPLRLLVVSIAETA